MPNWRSKTCGFPFKVALTGFLATPWFALAAAGQELSCTYSEEHGLHLWT
ncbi:MAG: hypothetical protein ACREAQ_03070 [Nitrososphaera sp.]